MENKVRSILVALWLATFAGATAIEGCGLVDWKQWLTETGGCALGATAEAAGVLAEHLPDNDKGWGQAVATIAVAGGVSLVKCATAHLIQDMYTARVAGPMVDKHACHRVGPEHYDRLISTFRKGE